ncbi:MULTISPECIES: hypothetical protein [Sphingobacterium]|uniref:hypothetical protein n=1 Tax=Sphingobacterium TaxID=28453 RepID=UPI00095A4F28|nr:MULTISPECIES: hypothetical protein [Sphingobacterium]OJZ08069.1 MAG: hypothetical protein BGP15_15720 [Sphingobacterium sp. 40-24]
MNGIIFQGKSLNVGCTATFLFEPEVGVENIPAIAELSTGEKAYAEILRDTTTLITVRVGEYLNEKGKRANETAWMLTYNHHLKSWQITKNLNTK